MYLKLFAFLAVKLTVDGAVTITANKEEVEVPSHTQYRQFFQVILFCKVEGVSVASDYSFQWHKTVKGDTRPIPDLDNRNLYRYFTNVFDKVPMMALYVYQNADESGVFTCSVTKKADTKNSYNATISMHVFDFTAISPVAKIGEPATLACTVQNSSSEDDFRFNWFHANYTKIEGNEMYTVDNGTMKDGVQNSTLIIANVTEFQSFRCKMWNHEDNTDWLDTSLIVSTREETPSSAATVTLAIVPALLSALDIF